MAGAIMEKVWGLFGMDPAEDREEEEVENCAEEEDVEVEDEEQEERKLWGKEQGLSYSRRSIKKQLAQYI